MKHMYKDSMKPFIHAEITNTVKELALTQEQTAEILGIEDRTYYYFKSGKTMCSATTLLIYLACMCPDTKKFIAKLKIAVNKAINK